MLLNLIAFKFVPCILKCLDACECLFLSFFIFNCKFIYIYIIESKLDEAVLEPEAVLGLELQRSWVDS